ncbi:toll/interleukin-1 receptor domain-containing protein [Sphaerotilus montanus]|uniref:toll/interleukin-1 receptor domain-containing protein n=1 Tax=Sphaerotilus montanus TaxID=522889 RepID=UPI0015CD264B|nr:toll/interleukin-1 receptor domain-containing protein [Sphaerotilus montanus]
MSDIYLSYSHRDAARVAPVAAELRKLGLSVWMDQEIQAGAHWMEEIERALHESPLLVLCLTPDYVASSWANVEIGVAISRSRSDAARVVPVLFRPTIVPMLLQSKMYIDARELTPRLLAEKINAIARQTDP